MAKITITGYEVACDPGINHFSTYKGEPIDVNDIQPGMNLERLITSSWWRRSDHAAQAVLIVLFCSFLDVLPSQRFAFLIALVEMRDTGALFHYGINDIFVEFGHSKQIDKVGLSYAYAELWVKVEE